MDLLIDIYVYQEAKIQKKLWNVDKNSNALKFQLWKNLISQPVKLSDPLFVPAWHVADQKDTSEKI